LKIAIVIPTYNERENIKSLIPRVSDVLKDNGINGDIIIVDDSSPDGTGDVVKAFSEKLGNVVLISRKEKLGLGSAYKSGFGKAFSLDFDGIMEMDADGSHDPLLIPKFIKKLEEGFHLVIGSRYIAGGEIGNWSADRRLISRGASFFIRFLFSSRIQDPTSGYRIITRESLKILDLSKVNSDGYTFQVEMTLRCEKTGLKVCEIPIRFVDRDFGKSKLSWKEMLRFFKEILELFISGMHQ